MQGIASIRILGRNWFRIAFLRKAKETIVSCKDYKEGYSAIVAYEKVAMISSKHNVFSKKSISRHISALVKTLKGRFSQTEQVV